MANRMVLPDSERFGEAIESVRKRVPIARHEWDALQAAERETAFTVANVTEMRVLQQVLDGVEAAVRDGTTLEDFRADIGPSLIESWGGEIPGRMETVFRTNIQVAYSQGRHAINSAPVVREARPYLRFDDVPSDRECELCEECGGTVLPADDPWWHTHTPPLHHCCECTATALSPEEAAEEGIDDAGAGIDADDGFGGEPSAIGEDWEPDLSEFSPELRAELETRLGR